MWVGSHYNNNYYFFIGKLLIVYRLRIFYTIGRCETILGYHRIHISICYLHKT